MKNPSHTRAKSTRSAKGGKLSQTLNSMTEESMENLLDSASTGREQVQEVGGPSTSISAITVTNDVIDDETAGSETVSTTPILLKLPSRREFVHEHAVRLVSRNILIIPIRKPIMNQLEQNRT